MRASRHRLGFDGSLSPSTAIQRIGVPTVCKRRHIAHVRTVTESTITLNGSASLLQAARDSPTTVHMLIQQNRNSGMIKNLQQETRANGTSVSSTTDRSRLVAQWLVRWTASAQVMFTQERILLYR